REAGHEAVREEQADVAGDRAEEAEEHEPAIALADRRRLDGDQRRKERDRRRLQQARDETCPRVASDDVPDAEDRRRADAPFPHAVRTERRPGARSPPRWPRFEPAC